MRRIPALLALAGGIAVLAGCGGGGSSSAKPPVENPGRVMTSVIRHELEGERELSYKMLIREQRKIVPARFYASCSPGPAMLQRDVDVDILGIHDELFAVPGLGKTKTKAVDYRMTVHGGGGEPMKLSHTGHLIAQEGHWRWTLSASSFDSFTKGFCP